MDGNTTSKLLDSAPQFILDISIRTTTSPIVNSTRLVTRNAYEWRYILPPYFFIFLLSITGNCLVIATLISNRKMRTVTNVYLLNLAISDFLLGVFCLPFTLIGQIFRRFLFGRAMCKIIPYLQAVSVSVDVWTLVALSAERYFAICRPLKSRRWQTQGHAYNMIAAVWLFSLVLNSPILYVSTLQSMRGNAFKCREVWSSIDLERGFNITLDAALLLIPLVIMCFAYALIVSKLWRGMQREIKQNQTNVHKLARQICGSCKATHVIPAGSSLFEKPISPCHEPNGTSNGTKDAVVKNGDCCRQASSETDFRHAIRSTHIDKSIKAKRKVIRMLFVIILEFFVCWTPLHIINTVYLFYPEKLYRYIGSKGIAWFQLLAYCSSCSNPITYCFMNNKFRLAFINLLRKFSLFACCFSKETESLNQRTPHPSSQDMNTCNLRPSNTTGTVRTELEGLESEECV